MEDWFSTSVEMALRCHFAVLFSAVAKKYIIKKCNRKLEPFHSIGNYQLGADCKWLW